LKNIFLNKSVLITGGCGSVGAEIIDDLLLCDPKVIRIFDINETGLYNLRNKYQTYDKIRYLLGNVRDRDRIIRASENVDIIIHAAALKHVFFCEYNPFEAVQTNVHGTQNVIDAALENSVEKMIFTSSDKAVNPTNVMGMTKLLAERLVVSANYYKGMRDTQFSCLRFGNIFGSSGSVISLFRKQIEEGIPITITDQNMTRFVMTKKEATNFIFSAIEHTKGGEIFISKMNAVNIEELAKSMMEVYNPSNTDLGINYIGKSPGEKIFEELLTETELDAVYEHDDMYILVPEFDDYINENIHEYIKLDLNNSGNIRSDTSPLLNNAELVNFITRVFEGC
jgi:UDP-N-acetylglucosamine 4,6-dehydratase/5-epimerase